MWINIQQFIFPSFSHFTRSIISVQQSQLLMMMMMMMMIGGVKYYQISDVDLTRT
jgi:hypothetical protein